MNSYSLTDVKNKQEEVFKQAMIEPVIVTKQSNPSHVLMSFDIYQNLVQKLRELEDSHWGEMAEKAYFQEEMVGEKQFIEELQKLANGET